MKKSVFGILILLVVVSFFLRAFKISQNLFFGPEQGIDFQVIKDIVVNKKLTLIGPKTDIDGIFHGPLYYYLSSLPFIISGGNPLAVSYFFILINSLTVILIYLLGKEFFKSSLLGLLAALFYTFSFGIIIYSRWLSTHPLTIPLSCLFYLFFYRFLKGSRTNFIGVFISYGLLTQAEFLNFLFFGVILAVLLIIYFRKIKRKNLVYTFFVIILGLIISVSNFLLFDIRHNFLITNNLLKVIRGELGYYISYSEAVSSSMTVLMQSFTRVTIGPQSLSVMIIVFIISLIFLMRQASKKPGYYILLLWILIPVIFLIFTRHGTMEQFFIVVSPAFILLITALTAMLFKKSTILAILTILTIISLNLSSWYRFLPTNRHIFFQSTQPDLSYQDELKTLDWIYTSSNNQPFSYQAYTIPYWMPQAWQYLFWFYGKNKYGYEPDSQSIHLRYIIIQNSEVDRNYLTKWYERDVNNLGKLIDSQSFGDLKVEKRIIN